MTLFCNLNYSIRLCTILLFLPYCFFVPLAFASEWQSNTSYKYTGSILEITIFNNMVKFDVSGSPSTPHLLKCVHVGKDVNTVILTSDFSNYELITRMLVNAYENKSELNFGYICKGENASLNHAYLTSIIFTNASEPIPIPSSCPYEGDIAMFLNLGEFSRDSDVENHCSAWSNTEQDRIEINISPEGDKWDMYTDIPTAGQQPQHYILDIFDDAKACSIALGCTNF